MKAGAIQSWFESRLCGKPIEVPADVPYKHAGQVMAESIAHHDTLDDHILTVRGHPIGWYLPTAISQPIG